ncbi:hypothetical protein HY404_02170 [Candidatus Microgenomates bacterium]|nr:hypothetical protein [Candidatus Microgenomates bacterium]
MNELTPRQAHILKALIEEYIEAAEPVGSETLEKKYSLGVSPATIRNEMVALTRSGFLKQTFSSAGRIPTSRGLRFYVQQLMDEKQLSVTEEVSAKERIKDSKRDVDHVMREATRALAQSTGTLAIGALEDDDSIWHAGYAKILEKPEFYNIDVTSHVLAILEEVKRIQELFFEKLPGEPVAILFGEELGWPYFEPIGIVATKFLIGNKGRHCAVGVVGPARLPFSYVIPRVRYFGSLLSEAMRDF